MATIPRPGEPARRRARWSIKAIDVRGRSRPLPHIAVAGEPNGQLLEIASTEAEPALGGPFAGLGAIRADAFIEGPVPLRDAIGVWAPQIIDLFEDDPPRGESFAAPLIQERALAWYENDRRKSLAWHDEQLIIVPFGPDVVRIEFAYRPSIEDRLHLRQMRRLIPDFLPRWFSHEAWLDWNGYLGENTIKIFGQTLLKKLWPRRAVLVTSGYAGAIVGKVVNWMGKPSKLAKDPTFTKRLSYWEKQAGALGDSFPNIATVPPASPSRAVVFIHGTLSCGIRHVYNLSDWLKDRGPIYRYEHDTFLPIGEGSGKKLTDLIIAKLDYDHLGELTLIAHSRGGLVARAAASMLPNPGKIKILTFGTPHTGTPLANVGEKALRAFATAASLGAAGLSPVPDPVTPMLSYLINSRRLPIGIASMAIGSQFLDGFNAAPDVAEIEAYGGIYDIKPEPSSSGVAWLHGFGREAFGDSDNDLIVPTQSATGRGEPYVISEACGHSEYFAKNEVLERLKGLGG